MATQAKRTDIDVEEFRKLLLKERSRLRVEHGATRRDVAEEAEDYSANELSTLDINEPGDAATAIFDKGLGDALDANTLAILAKIDHALSRIDDGTYGICEVTGRPIPVERLRALPWATMTVEAAEMAE
jgi:RNA polymerase-binding transcription factor DksA